jgi:DNA-binding winged helix-turn-helix (wHTH) protein
LVFNEFDAAFRTLNPRLFHSLRAMRDAYKDQVSYIIAVTNDLATLGDNLDEVEPFYYLVSSNVCYLGPLNEADTRYRLRWLAAQRCVGLSEQDIARMIELSGGYPSLFRVILNLLWDPQQAHNLADLAPRLKDEPAVQAECRKIWGSLAEKERGALRAVANGMPIAPPVLENLKRRGLVRAGPSRSPVIFASLFADFVRRQTTTSATSRVLIQRDTREVEIDGRQIKNLTELEFEAFCYLYEHRGQVCTKDELIENVYRLQHERMKGGVTDETLQTLISRLRDKIEPDRGPRYVVTVRGEGYRFVEPGEL